MSDYERSKIDSFIDLSFRLFKAAEDIYLFIQGRICRHGGHGWFVVGRGSDLAEGKDLRALLTVATYHHLSLFYVLAFRLESWIQREYLLLRELLMLKALVIV